MNPIFTVEIFGVVFADTIFVTLGVSAALVGLAALASRFMRTRRLGLWQASVETFTGWIAGTVGEIIEDDPVPYVAVIGTLILFIAVSNLLVLVPFIRPPTADLSTAVALALVVFGAVPYFGIRRKGAAGYFKGYVRPHPLLLPFNVIGELSRTLALAIRLFGNIMSGQMIGAILLVIAGALVPIPLMVLSIVTGLIQAYIFGILAAVYIAAAVQVEARDEVPPPEARPA